MQKRKLAIFINTLVRAGAEKVVANLLNELQDQFEIHLLMFNASEIEFIIPHSIILIQVGKPQKGEATPIDILKMPVHAWKIKRYLRKNNIPVLLSFLNRPNFISGLVKWMGFKGASIISERTMTSTYYNSRTLGGRIGRFLVSRLYRHPNLIITNSVQCEEDLRKTFGLKNKIITIHNPVNLKEAMDNRSVPGPALRKNPDEFVFCNIGRFNYIKNQELLLSAFKRLGTLNCRMVIIGKEVPIMLQEKVQKLGLQEKITLVGLQHNIYPYLYHSDVFVLSSRMEGFPNVIVEALACSLPVISTDCKSGPREILAPGKPYHDQWNEIEVAEFGILVENENEKMLADAMLRIMNDSPLREQFRSRAFERVKEFDLEIIINQFKDTLCSFYSD